MANPPYSEAKLHPVYAAMLDARPKEDLDPSTPIPVMREYMTNLMAESMRLANVPKVHREDLSIDSHGRSIKIIISRPPGSEHTVLPVLLFLHGGGFSMGNIDTHVKFVNDLSVKGNIAVVFVEYSLAPEHPFPAGLEDCYVAFDWILEHGKEHHLDASRVVIGGDSAGGTFTAALSMKLKDAGRENLSKGQILIYPCMNFATQRFPSHDLFGGKEFVLSESLAQLFTNLYFPDGPVQNKLAIPLLATPDDLRGLPPALLITAEMDFLRDEGEAYGRLLASSGTEVQAVRVIGTPHGFLTTPFEPLPYTSTLDTILSFLKNRFE
ncbi:Alpha/Beta hydrolase protein [Syncephalastrum racemosum]|uniref:Alpha/Beta hydrolase protein n=1 Tax=Syncephalastrum racemosum TaxID=13706 RepID=A0A1X2H4C2_SYNRA|nr:Alpha/Beta hydrolase protein [Syncephalastrum racemosum]